MREHKYRVWDIKNKEMLKPEHIELSWLPDGCLLVNGDDRVFEEGTYILMQYIERKDKKGKEIYEKDIIKVRQRIDDERGGYYLGDEEIIAVCDFDYENGCITWEPQDSEIIGNKYENPELKK